MTKLYVVSRFTIHEGKLAEFKECAQEAIAHIKANDTQTTHHEWFFSDDNTQCTVLEGYEDSQAALDHLGRIQALFGKILQISDFSALALGDVSPVLMQAVAGLNIEVQTNYAYGLALPSPESI